jgi:predicted dehydrogenase
MEGDVESRGRNRVLERGAVGVRDEGQAVRMAVVGLGYWGPNLVRVLTELPGVEVVAACDRDERRLADCGRRYPGVRLEREVAAVIEADDLDAVLIATPVSTHHELAAGALSAGKHVFVEKPLASSSADAIELARAAEAEGLVLMPGHTFLYSAPVNLIGDLIRRKELGDIYFISASRVNLGLHQPDVSVVWDLAPHDFSILCHWLGEMPVSVSARSRACIVPNLADVAFISLQYPSGAIVHVELSWLAPSKLRRTAVVGSEKMVVYDDTSIEPVRIYDSGALMPTHQSYGEYKMAYRSGDVVSPRLEVVEPLALELADFCHSIITGSKPCSSWELGLDVVLMCEAVDRSLDSDGAPAEVLAATAVAR